MKQVICKYGDRCKVFSFCFHSTYHIEVPNCINEGCFNEDFTDATCQDIRKIKLDRINSNNYSNGKDR